MTDDECLCGLDGEVWRCIDGRVYGPCDYENCNGVCDYLYDCDHECHTAPEPRATPREDS